MNALARGNMVSPIKREEFNQLPPLQINNGKLEPFFLNLDIIPYQMTLDEDSGDSIAEVQANSELERDMTNDRAGAIEIRTLSAVATSNSYLVRIFDEQFQRWLSNRALHSQNILGDGNTPFELPVPFRLFKNNILRWYFTDFSGSANDVRVVADGFRYYKDTDLKVLEKANEATRSVRPFFYTTDSSVQLPNDSAIHTHYITLESDADFYLKRIMTTSTGSYRMKIRSLSTQNGFSNGWIHSSLVGGLANSYKRSRFPTILQRKDKLQLEFINLSGGINNVYFCLVGEHYYYDR